MRPEWAPDGRMLVASGATNNDGPTAQVIHISRFIRIYYILPLIEVARGSNFYAYTFNVCLFFSQIIKRGNWDISCDLVGHRKVILNILLIFQKIP